MTSAGREHPAISRRLPAGRSRGMTLLEVIVAVSLTIGILGGAMSFYLHVAEVRNDFADRMGVVRQVEVRQMLMDRITDDLRSAITSPFLQMGLAGTDSGMQFITTVVPQSTLWGAENVLDQPVAAEQDVQIVGYSLRYGEDEDGLEIVEGIQRTVQTSLTAQVIEEGQAVEAALIAPQYKFLWLRYWDGQAGDWATGWDGGDLPLAVEIVLGREELPEDMEPADYPYETFRRVVYVPGGSSPTPGGSAIIRGLNTRRGGGQP